MPVDHRELQHVLRQPGVIPTRPNQLVILDHAPTDDDFQKPTDGLFVADSATPAFWIRVAGTWRSAVLS